MYRHRCAAGSTSWDRALRLDMETEANAAACSRAKRGKISFLPQLPRNRFLARPLPSGNMDLRDYYLQLGSLQLLRALNSGLTSSPPQILIPARFGSSL